MWPQQKTFRTTVGDVFFACYLAPKVPNTTVAEFANTLDPDKTTHNEQLIWIYNVCLLVFEFPTQYSLN